MSALENSWKKEEQRGNLLNQRWVAREQEGAYHLIGNEKTWGVIIEWGGQEIYLRKLQKSRKTFRQR